MKKNFLQKVLKTAVVLGLCLSFSIFPTSTFAETDNNEEIIQAVAGVLIFSIGDVDYDNSVTLKDAKIILSHALGIIPLDLKGREAGDANGDSTITLEDAQFILKMSLGIPYEDCF